MPSRGEIELQRRKLQTQNLGGYQCESAPGVLEDPESFTQQGRRPQSIEIVIHSQPSPPGPCEHYRRPAGVAEDGNDDPVAAGPRGQNAAILQIIAAIGRVLLALLTPALAALATIFSANNANHIQANGAAIAALSPCNATLPPPG